MYVEMGRGREQKLEGVEKAQSDEFAAYLAASDLHIVSEEIEVESRKRVSRAKHAAMVQCRADGEAKRKVILTKVPRSKQQLNFVGWPNVMSAHNAGRWHGIDWTGHIHSTFARRRS